MGDWIVINCTGEPFIVRDKEGNIIVFDDQKDAEAFCIEHSIDRYKLEDIGDLFDEPAEEDEDGEDD